MRTNELLRNLMHEKGTLPRTGLQQSSRTVSIIKATPFCPLNAMSNISREAADCVSAALRVIEQLVEVSPGLKVVQSAGSGGAFMEAVRNMQRAHELHPGDPLLHFSFASCLRMALQGREATAEMQKLAQAHPEFELAQIAVRGWEIWQPIFYLPVMRDDNKIPRIVSDVLPPEGSGLFTLRDGLLPVTAVFFRNTNTFANLDALRNAPIRLTTIVSKVTNPQVIGVYTRIWDNPSSPMTIEVVHTPFFRRGYEVRDRWEYFATHKELTLIIADRRDEIVLWKTLPFPESMRQTNQQLLRMFQQTDGRDISQGEFLTAVQRHQSYLPTDFPF